MALHGLENGVVDVLDRDIQVGADPVMLRDDREEFVRQAGWIGVEKADPGQALQGGQFPEEKGQGGPSGQVAAVGGGVLGDQDQFPDAAIGQALRLLEEIIDGRLRAFPGSRG